MSRRRPAPTPPPATSWLARHRATLRFVFSFALITLLYYVVVLLPWVNDVLFPAYLRANARLAAAVLHVLGQASTVDSATLHSPASGIAITVRRGCDALEPAWLFSAALLAFPVCWRRRLLGLLTGVSAILALNLVRIVSLYLVRQYMPGLFDTLHLEIWPVCFILAALGLWLFWARPVGRQPVPIDHAEA